MQSQTPNVPLPSPEASIQEWANFMIKDCEYFAGSIRSPFLTDMRSKEGRKVLLDYASVRPTEMEEVISLCEQKLKTPTIPTAGWTALIDRVMIAKLSYTHGGYFRSKLTTNLSSKKGKNLMGLMGLQKDKYDAVLELCDRLEMGIPH